VGNSAARRENPSAPDSTGRLLRAYHLEGDAGARSRLIELYLPLVETLARRYAHGGPAYEDLTQVGSIGLINAIDRFDLTRGGEFAAFAVPNISGEMKRHLRDSGHTIKLPRGLAELRGQIPAAREGLIARLGREPSATELALELDADEDAVASVLTAAPGGPADEALIGGDEGFLDADERLALADAFGDLDERERRIVYLRFVKDLDPEQVARELGISRRHLSRQTEAALKKLRRHLEASPAPKLPEMDSGPSRESARYLDRPYHIVLVRNDDEEGGGWTAQVEELPGCEARADTPDEATHAVRASMEAWISEALATSREIPEPRGASSHSGRLMLRMPQSLHAELARAAERDEVSLNQFITGSLAGAVGWRQQNGGEDLVEPEHSEPVTEEPAPAPKRSGGRWLGRALVANAVLVGLAGIAALTLLVVVLTHG
jgi:RNA polymerase sigma-B factor